MGDRLVGNGAPDAQQNSGIRLMSLSARRSENCDATGRTIGARILRATGVGTSRRAGELKGIPGRLAREPDISDIGAETQSDP